MIPSITGTCITNSHNVKDFTILATNCCTCIFFAGTDGQQAVFASGNAAFFPGLGAVEIGACSIANFCAIAFFTVGICNDAITAVQTCTVINGCTIIITFDVASSIHVFIFCFAGIRAGEDCGVASIRFGAARGRFFARLIIVIANHTFCGAVHGPATNITRNANSEPCFLIKCLTSIGTLSTAQEIERILAFFTGHCGIADFAVCTGGTGAPFVISAGIKCMCISVCCLIFFGDAFCIVIHAFDAGAIDADGGITGAGICSSFHLAIDAFADFGFGGTNFIAVVIFNCSFAFADGAFCGCNASVMSFFAFAFGAADFTGIASVDFNPFTVGVAGVRRGGVIIFGVGFAFDGVFGAFVRSCCGNASCYVIAIVVFLGAADFVTFAGFTFNPFAVGVAIVHCGGVCILSIGFAFDGAFGAFFGSGDGNAGEFCSVIGICTAGHAEDGVAIGVNGAVADGHIGAGFSIGIDGAGNDFGAIANGFTVFEHIFRAIGHGVGIACRRSFGNAFALFANGCLAGAPIFDGFHFAVDAFAELCIGRANFLAVFIFDALDCTFGAHDASIAGIIAAIFALFCSRSAIGACGVDAVFAAGNAFDRSFSACFVCGITGFVAAGRRCPCVIFANFEVIVFVADDLSIIADRNRFLCDAGIGRAVAVRRCVFAFCVDFPFAVVTDINAIVQAGFCAISTFRSLPFCGLITGGRNSCSSAAGEE